MEDNDNLNSEQTPLKTDFLDAHMRHWDDAELLFNETRWANADHLYGLAVECGLKRLMIAFGMIIDPATGSPQSRDDRVHANHVWARYESYRSGYHDGINYPLPAANPFQNWDISQRYAHQSGFTRVVAECHRSGARSIHDLITKAILEGIIP